MASRGTVYTKYKEHILPILLDSYNNAFQKDALPDSFYDATIVILLKPEKDPEECSFYRPISLINTDYKIQTKMLASRLNKVILNLIHADQMVFMPGKSTSENK